MSRRRCEGGQRIIPRVNERNFSIDEVGIRTCK
jgi:hypothetical protein